MQTEKGKNDKILSSIRCTEKMNWNDYKQTEMYDCFFFFYFLSSLQEHFALYWLFCLFIIPHSFCFWCRYCKNLFVWEWCFTIFSLPISLMDFPYSLFFFSFPYVLVVRISSKIKQYLLADISLYSHCSSLIASKWIIALRRTKLLSVKGFLTN